MSRLFERLEVQISVKLNTAAIDLLIGALRSHEQKQLAALANCQARSNIRDDNGNTPFTATDFGIPQTVALREQLTRYYERAMVAA